MPSQGQKTVDLTAPIRVGLGLVTAAASEVGHRIPGVFIRLPIEVLNRALHAGELAAKGYGELTRRGEQTVSLVRQRIGLGDGAAGHGRATARPAVDPYTGGPLEPVDDIREAVWLSREDAADVESATPGAALERDELPLDDYDHLTLGSLRARIRRLDAAQLVQLREYEQAHADRLPVIKALDTRLAKLAQESGQPADAPV